MSRNCCYADGHVIIYTYLQPSIALTLNNPLFTYIVSCQTSTEHSKVMVRFPDSTLSNNTLATIWRAMRSLEPSTLPTRCHPRIRTIWTPTLTPSFIILKIITRIIMEIRFILISPSMILLTNKLCIFRMILEAPKLKRTIHLGM